MGASKEQYPYIERRAVLLNLGMISFTTRRGFISNIQQALRADTTCLVIGPSTGVPEIPFQIRLARIMVMASALRWELPSTTMYTGYEYIAAR